jgi:hypothetical protein
LPICAAGPYCIAAPFGFWEATLPLGGNIDNGYAFPDVQLRSRVTLEGYLLEREPPATEEGQLYVAVESLLLV